MSTLILLAVTLAILNPAPIQRLQQISGTPARGSGRLLLSIAVISGVGAFLVLGSLTVTLAAFIAVGACIWTLRDLSARRKARHRESSTATFLGHLIGELSAGSSMPTAVTRASSDLPSTTPPEVEAALRTVAGHTSRGASGADALIREAQYVPELSGLGDLWALADRYGLPLTPLVEQAQSRIDTRVRHRAATTATLQGPQATAIILTLLPVAGIAMGTAMGAQPLHFLLGGGLGGLLLVLGVGLSSCGFIWSRHIIAKAAA